MKNAECLKTTQDLAEARAGRRPAASGGALPGARGGAAGSPRQARSVSVAPGMAARGAPARRARGGGGEPVTVADSQAHGVQESGFLIHVRVSHALECGDR